MVDGDGSAGSVDRNRGSGSALCLTIAGAAVTTLRSSRSRSVRSDTCCAAIRLASSRVTSWRSGSRRRILLVTAIARAKNPWSV